MKLIRKGVYGYYSGKPKKLKTLYISYKDEFGKAKKERVDTLDAEIASALCAARKVEITAKKKKVTETDMALRTGNATLDQIAETFFSSRATANNKKDQQRYENHIKPVFGKKVPAKVTESAVKKWRDSIELASKTKNDIVSILKMLLPEGHAVKDLEKLSIDKNAQKGRVMKESELEQFFYAVKDNAQLNLFSRLCYYTGARPQAILELTPNNFHDTEDGMTVEIKSMKGADSYNAPIEDDLMDLVDKWIEDNHLDDDDALFFGQQSIERATGIKEKAKAKEKPVEYCVISKRIKDVCDPLFNLTRRGKSITDKTKRVSIYTLRRTAATNIAKKVSLVAAQKFLNHQDPKTTMKYIGLDNADVRAAVGVL